MLQYDSTHTLVPNGRRAFFALRNLLGAGCFCLLGASLAQAAAPAPRTFLVLPGQYVRMREEIAAQSLADWKKSSSEALRSSAEKTLSEGPWSVMEKPDRQIAPSGDKHDYVSMSSYWWPGADGAYEWRDGKINPEMVFQDEKALGDLMGALKILGPAGYLLKDDRYTDRAIFLVNRWFLDPATRMNPNLNYAAGIPGQASGRGFGLHRMKEMPAFVDILGLLATSPHWTAEQDAGMKAWVAQYLRWAATNELGLQEKSQPNNHSVYYGAHVLAAALYVNDKPLIHEFSQEFFQTHLIKQIAPDGELPEEMKRTRPYNYTIYTLTGFCHYAELARSLGLDYYNYRGPDGQTLKKAFEKIVPFLRGDVPSPRPEEEAMRLSRVLTTCRLAAIRCELPFMESYLQEKFPKWTTDQRNLVWPPAR